MSTDRELLELAAKACGDTNIKPGRPDFTRWIGRNEDIGCDVVTLWNPILNDGDALRLAIKLKITIQFPLGHKCKLMQETRCWNDYDDPAIEEHKDDPYAATRRAIVRAAAEIGRQMQEGGAA